MNKLFIILFFSFTIYSFPQKLCFENPEIKSGLKLKSENNIYQYSYCVEKISLQDSSINKAKGFYIGLRSGYRFNLSSVPSLNSNLYFGVLVEIPLSHIISIQPELNFWHSKTKDQINPKTISVVDIPLLLNVNVNLEEMGFCLSAGLGILSENDKNDKLISLNFGLNYWIELQSLKIIAQTRLQKAGSLEPGGGNSVTSLMLGVGLQVPINLN